ncbi:choice-of-anchor E domain-containing protein, partial [candidate division KSB1 bacterium]|nr:choice-of-anchor E domain-containing protein [candidate division KSB1 bacterium]
MNIIQRARPFYWPSIVFMLFCMTPVIAQQAEPESVTHCEEYIMVDNEVDGSIPLPHFDATLGRLVGAEINVEMQTDHTLGVENTSQGGVNVRFNIICTGHITAPLQSSATTLETGISIDEMHLETYDGTFDFDGPSGEFYDELHGSGGLFETNIASFTYTGSDLSFFPGTGTFDLPLDAETSFDVIGGGGNAQVEITTDGVMNACVIYYYV